jgi:hypothetical protein
MTYYIKSIVVSAILIACILSNSGCAAAWFLAGAGTAASVITATQHKDAETEEKDKEEYFDEGDIK